MKIGIVGLGFVGSAVAYAHRKHELIIRDPKLGVESASIQEILICEAVYVCVPTPMHDDSSCNTAYVESALQELESYKGTIICKSTVPPTSYARLAEQYSNIVHSPEFLTAANAVDDYVNAKWVLVGGNELWVERAVEIIKSSDVAAVEYVKTDIKTAALFKYLANCFLATKVTLLNDFYRLANSLDVDWTTIKELGLQDPRLGTSHWDVPGPDGKFGFGGGCFPKDLSAIIKEAEQTGIEMRVLDSVRAINSIYRK